MKTLTCIQAHHGVEEICRRHLCYWSAHADVIFFCPWNSCLTGDWKEPIILGLPGDLSSHHGTAATRRLRTLFKVLSAITNYDYYVVAEYDGIYLGEPSVRNGELGGSLFLDYTADSKFVGHHFPHCPWTMDGWVLKRLLAGLNKLPDDAEDGMADRLIGLACEREGIPFHDFLAAHEGYSQNTIEPKHEAELVAAVKAGAKMFHGVKSAWVLHTILDNQK